MTFRFRRVITQDTRNFVRYSHGMAIVGVAHSRMLDGLKPPLLLFDKIVVDDLNYSIAGTRRIEGPLWRVWRGRRYPPTIGEALRRLGRKLGVVKQRKAVWQQLEELKQAELLLDEREYLETFLTPEEADALSYDYMLRYVAGVAELDGAPLDWGDPRRQRVGALAAEGHSRVVAALLRERAGIDAIPVAKNEDRGDLFLAGKEQVVRVLFHALPQPDPAVASWQAILEFRKDPETRGRLAVLRRWLNELVEKELTVGEVRDHVEAVAFEFEQHMKRCRMKYKLATVEALLTTTTNLAKNIATLQFGNVAQDLVGIGHAKVALLEAEQAAPGRELAYLFHSTDSLQK